MSQEEEEELLFQKVANLKKDRDLLYVIFEELDEMMQNGYTCSSCCDETSNLRYAYEEYRTWRSKNR